MSTSTALSPSQRGQHGQEEVGIHREEQHLEDRVERHQSGGILAVAAREVVPHNHHRDAARQPNQDQAGHVFGLVAQEQHRKRKHENRSDNPVLNERKQQHPAVLEDAAHLLVLHLCQRRIHHQDQADRNGDRGCACVEAVQERHHARHEVAQRNAGCHGGEDPEREVAVEKRQPGLSIRLHPDYLPFDFLRPRFRGAGTHGPSAALQRAAPPPRKALNRFQLTHRAPAVPGA